MGRAGPGRQGGRIGVSFISGNQDSKTDVFSCLMLSAFDILENAASWRGNLPILRRGITGRIGQVGAGELIGGIAKKERNTLKETLC